MNDMRTTTETKAKPCVCHVVKRSELIWKTTGRQNADRQSEYQCRVCGATAWRPA
jgi:hypothetical protein